ncbi:Tfp pilus assembly protein PilF [Pseudomonas alcaligenes]|uniref:Tfp pilus assembly protein PilF n=1 Tax=Aquipseudomonas alcaligenes TaxID=43263 RepID=A0ABR7S215_AQUAC|nr:tetratricopeptide repeat protein [Pseudomonas alcaligenes]MBC9250488.1 Tfp pilus assembly protein PilF [Pseudomonas alcaligenes]
MNRKILLIATLAAVSGCQSMGPTLTDRGHSLYRGENALLYEVQAQADSPEQAMRMGAAAYQGGALDQALYQYLRALELDPERYEALVWIGRIHRERGNQHLAELAFSDVLSKQPDNPAALAEMGQLQLAMQQPDRARELLGRAVALDQKRLGGTGTGAPEGFKVDAASPLKVYNAMGVLADLKGDFDQAAGYYRLAAQIDPRSALVANSMAYSLYLAGKWPEAEQQYRRGISYDSRYQPLWRNYGLLLARMERYEEALSAFEQVEKRAEASNDVGYVCLIEGKLDVAEQFFRSAIEQSPGHYDLAWENLSRVEQIQRIRQHSSRQQAPVAEAVAVTAVAPPAKLQVLP